MARLDHPNVISFYKMGDYSGCPYILMDYVYGINLEEYLVTKGRPDTKTFFNILTQTASAIEAIHKAGVIHRDIKLKNIMLEVGKEIVKLTDFGIAMAVEEGSDITHDGYIVGTPIYMAPEMFQGSSATVKSDIYSFGITFYQFATASPPFVAKTNSDLYDQHKNTTPPEMRKKTDDDFPQELDDLIRKKCMAKKPADRPDSISEILSELRKIKRKYIDTFV
jgi:serine/threonine-protein kinase